MADMADVMDALAAAVSEAVGVPYILTSPSPGSPSGSSDEATIMAGATQSTPYQVQKTDLSVYVNKTLSSPTFLVLPANPALDEQHLVKDAKGDAGQNPITVSAGNTIDGQTSTVLAIGYEALTFRFNGSEWSIL